MQSLKDLKPDDLRHKKVFLRVDFNVPLDREGKIMEKYRIKSHKQMVDYLLPKEARVALVSHIDASGFKDLKDQIGEILGYNLGYEEDILNPKFDYNLTLFENIRKYKGEENNDSDFAKNLVANFDLYINDAFSVCHRNHSSVSAITGFLPSQAGFLVEKEIENLGKVLESPAEGKTIILGGAKISTKLPVIKNFIDKAEHILIGGVLANAIFKFKGQDIGRSKIDGYEEIEESLKEIDWDNPKIMLPKDTVVSDDVILDIGQETIKIFSEVIMNSKTIIFNGPLGLAEVDEFSRGTKAILDAIARSKAFSVVGGGDTLATIEKLGLIGNFSYVSTGGGAMLEFLAGNRLPGLEALGYYK